MPTADSRFYALFPLQEVIHDKTDGALLSGGIVTFYKDSARSVLKDVYQQAQAGDVYEYIPVQNPVTLTSIGSYGDDNGNDFIPFLFPFEGTPSSSDGSIELYYITVESSGNVDQFSREGWPPGLTAASIPADSNISATNLLTNPAFSEVLFDASGSTAFVTAAPSSTLNVAPGWDVLTTGTGAGTVTVTQVPIAGDAANNVGNPPYALQVASTGVSTIKLRQRLEHSPGLIATGFISATMAVRSTVGAIAQVTMTYAPSSGDSHELAQGLTTADNAWLLINTAPNGDSAVEIGPVINSQTSATGYVDIIVTLPPNTTVQISNLQISAVSSVISSAAYVQASVAEMTNGLYWYDRPQLEYKPIPSYLVGWDFPLNPCQGFNPANIPVAAGANFSRYIADQTITFQTVTNSLSATVTDAGLNITAAAPTSFSVLQYLPATTAVELLSQRMSTMIKAFISTGTLAGRVGLYWTTATIPTLSSSIVTGITAGVPTITGTWTEVERSGLGTASFTVSTTSASTPFEFNGFDATAVSGIDGATAFAIVLTFNTMTAATLTLNYVSLNGGDIATRPAPQTRAAVLLDCQYYYQSSFPYGTAPAANTSGGIYSVMGGASGANQRGPNYVYPTPLRTNVTPVLYNPQQAASSQIYNLTSGTPWADSVVDNASAIAFATKGTAVGAGYSLLSVNFTSDARLGVV